MPRGNVWGIQPRNVRMSMCLWAFASMATRPIATVWDAATTVCVNPMTTVFVPTVHPTHFAEAPPIASTMDSARLITKVVFVTIVNRTPNVRPRTDSGFSGAMRQKVLPPSLNESTDLWIFGSYPVDGQYAYGNHDRNEGDRR